jgi:hypothetical protein
MQACPALESTRASKSMHLICWALQRVPPSASRYTPCTIRGVTLTAARSPRRRGPGRRPEPTPPAAQCTALQSSLPVCCWTRAARTRAADRASPWVRGRARRGPATDTGPAGAAARRREGIGGSAGEARRGCKNVHLCVPAMQRLTGEELIACIYCNSATVSIAV